MQAFGAGKVILLGEHAVVYGYPALAAPLSFGVTARARPARRCALVLPARLKGPEQARLARAFRHAAHLAGRPGMEVRLESDLPVSVGLGSSAAVSVACARVLLGPDARPERVLKLALAMEREFHGSPSGVDHTTSALGQLIRYRPLAKGVGRAQEVKSRRPLKLLVAVVGARTPTRETVAGLKERLGLWPRRYGRLLKEIGALTGEGVRAIETGDLEALGDAMNVNHGLLSGLGLSSARIDERVHQLRALGALGAKLTGAGGDGGAVIGLFWEPEPAVARLSALGVQCFASHVAGPQTL